MVEVYLVKQTTFPGHLFPDRPMDPIPDPYFLCLTDEEPKDLLRRCFAYGGLKTANVGLSRRIRSPDPPLRLRHAPRFWNR